MGNNWLNYSLGDLIDVKHGFAFKGEYMRDDINQGPIVVAIGNFDYSGGFRFSETKTKRYTSEYPIDFTLQAGDMLLAMTCQTSGGEILGIPGVIPNDGQIYLHNQRLGKVVVKEPGLICLEYLYWLFLSQDFNKFIFQRATGTKILHTSPNTILEYQNFFPPLAEQRIIAGHLWQLQNKIILNRQINQTLEQMAQTLFKSWFVDFDPVVDNALDAGFFAKVPDLPDELLRRAEARKAVRMQEGFKPLPPATRQLFPAAFEPCDDPSLGLGGWVPKGWHVLQLSEIAKVTSGKRPPSKGTQKTKDEPVPVWGGNGIKWFTSIALSDDKHIITGRVGTLGTLYKVNGPSWASDNALVIRPSQEYFYDFIFHALSLFDIGSLNSGSTQPLVTQSALNGIKFIFPINQKSLAEFQIIMDKFNLKVDLNMQEVDSLVRLKDALLPKLITGDIEVEEVL